MKPCPPGQEFVFCDGAIVDTVGKLVDHIKTMPPEQYMNHVNDSKNDIYNWIHDCISKDVASDVKGNKPQKEMIEKLTGHLWQHEHKGKHRH